MEHWLLHTSKEWHQYYHTFIGNDIAHILPNIRMDDIKK